MPKPSGKRRQLATDTAVQPLKKAKKNPLQTVAQEPSDADTDGSSSSNGSSEAADSESSMSSRAECQLEFFDPQEKDWTGLEALLRHYLDGREWHCGELADTIIHQSTVGTVIKTDEEEDAVGVASVLSTARHGSLDCMKEVAAFLFDNCPQGQLTDQFKQAWQGSHTGLLINERVINCPPELGPPSQQALFDEIAWATEDEAEEKDRDMFKFTRYILVARCYADNSAPPTLEPEAAIKSKKKKRKKQLSEPHQVPLLFWRPEDEFYHKNCSCSFSFAAPSSGSAPGEESFEPRRCVMLLTPAQISAARLQLEEVVPNAAEQ